MLQEMNNAPQAPEPDPSQQESQDPLDEVVNMLDSYIKDPAQITPETLTSLRDQVIAIRDGVNADDAPPQESAPAPEPGSMSAELMARGK